MNLAVIDVASAVAVPVAIPLATTLAMTIAMTMPMATTTMTTIMNKAIKITVTIAITTHRTIVITIASTIAMTVTIEKHRIVLRTTSLRLSFPLPQQTSSSTGLACNGQSHLRATAWPNTHASILHNQQASSSPPRASRGKTTNFRAPARERAGKKKRRHSRAPPSDVRKQPPAAMNAGPRWNGQRS